MGSDWGRLLNGGRDRPTAKEDITKEERDMRRQALRDNGVMIISEWERTKSTKGDTITAQCMHCRKEYQQVKEFRRNLTRFCSPECTKARHALKMKIHQEVRDAVAAK